MYVTSVYFLHLCFVYSTVVLYCRKDVAVIGYIRIVRINGSLTSIAMYVY
jgi:hypothetical protein